MIDCSKCPERGSCCGPFPFKKDLFERNKDKMQVTPIKIIDGEKTISFITEDLLCVFLNRKTRLCSIYGDRPPICKIYGTKIVKNHMITCPYFKPNGNPWSKAKATQIKRIQEKDIDNLMKRYKS